MAIEIKPLRTLAARLHRRILAIKAIRPVNYDRCAAEKELHLIDEGFHFVGKGRDQVVKVKLQARPMVALLKALRTTPSLQVTQSWDSVYSGSFRTHMTQAFLYKRYEHGGPLAAPPCSSYHEAGVSVDLYEVTDDERKAMETHGFHSLLPEDPPHFTYGRTG